MVMANIRNEEATKDKGGAALLDAAAQLKGMLGIGPTTDADKDVTVDISNKAENRGPIESNGNVSPKSQKKKKNKKNKLKQVKKDQQSTPSNIKQHQRASNNSSGNGKKSGKNKKKNGNKNTVNGGNQNKYAWSAFQASPDASSLPLPAFQDADGNGPEKLGKNLVVTESSSSAEKNLSSPASTVKPSSQDEIVDHDLVKETKQSDHLQSVDLIRELLHAPRSDDEKKTAKGAVANEDESSLSNDFKKISMSNVKEVKSSSGINLADVITKSPTRETNLIADQQTSLPSVVPPPVVLSHHQPTRGVGPIYGSPPPMHMHPHFVTIQVQVPENNGYMMVNTPAGYPVPVQIPPGVRPGMVIPVNVPIPPTGPPAHPGQMMPMQNGPYMMSHPPPHQQPQAMDTDSRSWVAAASNNRGPIEK